MGARLLAYYQEAERIGQLKAKMRLALLTSISSAKAGEVPDTPEVIKSFETAMQKIKLEFSSSLGLGQR